MNETSHEYQGRDVLDEIDDTVAQFTDKHIEDRLQETLRRVGRGNCCQHALVLTDRAPVATAFLAEHPPGPHTGPGSSADAAGRR